MKAPVKKYLSITKKEWNGLVVLVVLMLLILLAPTVYQQLHKDKAIDTKDFDNAAALLSKAKDTVYNDAPNGRPVNLFKFDPNDVTLQQWEQLGLSEHEANVILHYLAKGGHFYKKEDLRKIYGITAADYKRLEPYIDIPNSGYVSNKVAAGVVIELNSADSARLTQIRGVGPAFAQRIIEYRTRLGGFLRKEQLQEVYGIDTSRYAQLKNEVSVDPSRIKKIDINAVDFEGLRKFPYLTNKQTNAIIQYRKQHGDYHSIADMKNIAILDDDILRKIEPYLSFK